MSNKILQYMQKEGNGKYTNADLLNFIRENASDSYKADIKELDSLTKINHNTVPYSAYEIHQNEFFDILINRIGSTVVKGLSWNNPLSMFKTESFDFGETHQELYVGLAKREDFNAKSGEHPYKFYDTDIKAFYHDINREDVYSRTIEKNWTIKAFASDYAFDSFIDKMIMTILSSDQLDEYELVKDVLTRSLSEITVNFGNGEEKLTAKSTEIDTTQDNWLQVLNKDLIKRVNYFKTPSTTRFENAANVPNTTPTDDIYLITTAELSAELDSMLANAFNMDKASVMAKKIVVDELPEFTGEGKHNGAKPLAVLISKNALIMKDKLFTMVNSFNPKTLTYNYFLHHHQLVSYSLFENMHVYYSK